MSSDKRSERGFTLIEMLVALAIFSLAALALLRLEGATVANTARLGDQAMAQAVARNIAVETMTDPVAPALGSNSGTVINGGRPGHGRVRLAARRAAHPDDHHRGPQPHGAGSGHPRRLQAGRGMTGFRNPPRHGEGDQPQAGGGGPQQGSAGRGPPPPVPLPVPGGTDGFTIVELLVSLFIFGLLSAAGVALLSFSVRAQALAGERLDEISQFRRFGAIVTSDLAQASPRISRDGNGAVRPAFVGGTGLGEPASVSLVRRGWDNLDGSQRSSLQKVEYRVSGNRWSVLPIATSMAAPRSIRCCCWTASARSGFATGMNAASGATAGIRSVPWTCRGRWRW
jgi:type II secretion system protein I